MEYGNLIDEVIEVYGIGIFAEELETIVMSSFITNELNKITSTSHSYFFGRVDEAEGMFPSYYFSGISITVSKDSIIILDSWYSDGNGVIVIDRDM